MTSKIDTRVGFILTLCSVLWTLVVTTATWVTASPLVYTSSQADSLAKTQSNFSSIQRWSNGQLGTDNIMNGSLTGDDFDGSSSLSLLDLVIGGDLTMQGGAIRSDTSLRFIIDQDSNGTEAFNFCRHSPVSCDLSTAVLSINESGNVVTSTAFITTSDDGVVFNVDANNDDNSSVEIRDSGGAVRWRFDELGNALSVPSGAATEIASRDSIEMRIDSNGDSTSFFKIVNGTGSTVVTVEESGLSTFVNAIKSIVAIETPFLTALADQEIAPVGDLTLNPGGSLTFNAGVDFTVAPTQDSISAPGRDANITPGRDANITSGRFVTISSGGGAGENIVIDAADGQMRSTASLYTFKSNGAATDETDVFNILNHSGGSSVFAVRPDATSFATTTALLYGPDRPLAAGMLGGINTGNNQFLKTAYCSGDLDGNGDAVIETDASPVPAGDTCVPSDLSSLDGSTSAEGGEKIVEIIPNLRCGSVAPFERIYMGTSAGATLDGVRMQIGTPDTIVISGSAACNNDKYGVIIYYHD